MLHEEIYEGCHVEDQKVGGKEVGEEVALWEVCYSWQASHCSAYGLGSLGLGSFCSTRWGLGGEGDSWGEGVEGEWEVGRQAGGWAGGGGVGRGEGEGR